MFRKVLFPTDFSAPADRLLECLDELRPLGFQEVVLLHVTDVRHAVNLLGFDLTYYERHNGLACNELQLRRKQVEAMGFPCQVVQVHDVPYQGIVHTAQQERCDLILMGSHGKTLAQEVLLGSVSENVVRHAPVPVLLAKLQVIQAMGHEVCEFACKRMLRKVLVPTDFSECAQEALQVIRGLRSAGIEELVLLHVQDIRKLRPHLAKRMDEFNRIDTRRLDNLRQDLSSQGFRVHTRLIEGVPFQEVVRVADGEDVGLIALCSHGRSAVAEMLLGSVAAEVIRHARRAVLVVRCPGMCPSTSQSHMDEERSIEV